MNGEGPAGPANLFTIFMIILAIVFQVMARATDPFPRPRGRRAVAQRAALDVEVWGWRIDQHDKVVRWLDHAALSKVTIAESTGERQWFYRGQDMHADGWPLFFTRSSSARGALAKEAELYAGVQDRIVPPGPDRDTPDQRSGRGPRSRAPRSPRGPRVSGTGPRRPARRCPPMSSVVTTRGRPS